MRKGYRATIPDQNHQPALELTWQADCQPSIDSAIACADRWLASDRSTYLWMTLMLGREQQSGRDRQTAFEVGFLTRLQQRLETAVPAAERAASAPPT